MGMSEAKHTPGPWEQQLRPDGVPFGIGAPESMVDDVNVLCQMPYSRWRSEGKIDELKANAALIAAAPVLLKTLQEAYRVLAESHMQNGELHWVTPGETLLERLSTVIEDTTGQKPPLPSPSV